MIKWKDIPGRNAEKRMISLFKLKVLKNDIGLLNWNHQSKTPRRES